MKRMSLTKKIIVKKIKKVAKLVKKRKNQKITKNWNF